MYWVPHVKNCFVLYVFPSLPLNSFWPCFMKAQALQFDFLQLKVPQMLNREGILLILGCKCFVLLGDKWFFIFLALLSTVFDFSRKAFVKAGSCNRIGQYFWSVFLNLPILGVIVGNEFNWEIYQISFGLVDLLIITICIQVPIRGILDMFYIKAFF